MSARPRVDVVLPPDPRSPATARRHVRSVLEAAGRQDVLEVALLLTTELVTNSVVHAGTSAVLEVVPGPTAVTVTVTDESPAATGDVVRALTRGQDESGTLLESGRGIQVLAALAARWGVVHTATTKSVWFDVGGSRPRYDAGPPPAPGRFAPAVGGRPPRRDLSWLTRMPDDVERLLDLDELLGELGSRLAEALEADALRVWVVAPDGEWRQAVARGPGMPGPARREPPRLANGDPVLIADLTREPGPFPPALAAAGLRAALAVPIRLDGVILGCLELAAGRHPAFDADAVALTRLTADRMALAIRSRWLTEAEQRRQGFLAFVAEASEMLAGTFDTRHTLAMLVQLCVPRLATTALVQLFDEHGQPRLAALADVDEARGAQLRERLADADRVTLDPAALAGAAPEDGTGAGGQALAVPLTARGRMLGTLGLLRRGSPPFIADDAVLAEDLARRAALAVDNARLYDEVADTARVLQRGLLPPQLPVTDRVEFGTSYAVAGEGIVVGGDFYDVVRMGENAWGLAIGDVCGKGACAAAVTGVARGAFRLLAPYDGRLADVLGRLNRLLLEQDDGSRFCTLAAAELRVGADALDVTLVSAGHPPPVLVSAGGSAAFVGELGTLVGVVPELELPETRLTLRRGDSLVFYTDGVIERRDDNGVMFGDERLLHTLAPCAGMPAQAMADALESGVRRFGSAPLRDDLAVLIVQAH